MCESIVTSGSSKGKQAPPSFEALRQAMQAAGIVVAHLINPDCAVVPSATQRDTLYILVRVNGAWHCNCPATGRCWHQDRAAQLVAVAPVADKQARYRAALADVFGVAA